jgi:hypothetical protein
MANRRRLESLREPDEIGGLGVGRPVGFDVGDFDGDCQIEMRTAETDWSAGQL